MFLKQALSASPTGLRSRSRLAAFPATATLLLLGGCTAFGGKDDAPAQVASAPRPATDSAPAEPEMTATEAAVAAQPEGAPSGARAHEIERSTALPHRPRASTPRGEDPVVELVDEIVAKLPAEERVIHGAE